MKRLTLLVVILCSGITIYSQNKPGGVFKHVIDVEAYSDWGKDYLTVIDPKYCYYEKTLIPTTYSPITNENAYFPGCGDIILELNGISTKNMSPEQFYNRVDTADTFELKFSTPNGEIFVQKYTVLRNRPWQMDYYYGFENFMLSNPIDSSALGRLNSYQNNPLQSISNNNYDFAKAKTYDYLIVGNDPLNDEKILDAIDKFNMKRDTKNPDIIFTIAKNLDESITHTYIPPTSRTINTGSTTTPHYNYITHTYSYTTKQNYQTIQEGGYTETTKTTDIFLELTALDARKINDKSISHAPIIWQMTAKENRLNSTQKGMDIYKIYASWACMPPVDRAAKKEQSLWMTTGLVPDRENPALVAEVRENSRAAASGFKVGDIVTKIECDYSGRSKFGNNMHYWFTITPKHIKEKRSIYSNHTTTYKSTRVMWDGMIECLNNGYNNYSYGLLSHIVTVTVIRDKKRVKLYLHPISHKITSYYWLNNEQLKRVRE